MQALSSSSPARDEAACSSTGRRKARRCTSYAAKLDTALPAVGPPAYLFIAFPCMKPLASI